MYKPSTVVNKLNLNVTIKYVDLGHVIKHKQRS
uniref:Transposase n=1 Tax=Schistosoma curassoni TaxID=6186 RepID=A0A183JDW9_9TREM